MQTQEAKRVRLSSGGRFWVRSCKHNLFGKGGSYVESLYKDDLLLITTLFNRDMLRIMIG